MTTIPTLEINDAFRIHGHGDVAVHALRGLTLTVQPGQLVAVIGPSGSGKSTLLNLAGGLDQASAGQVRVQGKELGSLRKSALAQLRRRRVGYVFQDFNLIPSLTAAENVALPLELDGIRTRRAMAQARDALDEVGMVNLYGRFPDDLSGGQQQRVAIARALIGGWRRTRFVA
jgi:putative ABC transport system ATP-binding protein